MNTIPGTYVSSKSSAVTFALENKLTAGKIDSVISFSAVDASNTKNEFSVDNAGTSFKAHRYLPMIR